MAETSFDERVDYSTGHASGFLTRFILKSWINFSSLLLELFISCSILYTFSFNRYKFSVVLYSALQSITSYSSLGFNFWFNVARRSASFLYSSYSSFFALKITFFISELFEL
jgi:hypothetical protein